MEKSSTVFIGMDVHTPWAGPNSSPLTKKAISIAVTGRSKQREIGRRPALPAEGPVHRRVGPSPFYERIFRFGRRMCQQRELGVGTPRQEFAITS
jgi:hypothetical protein